MLAKFFLKSSYRVKRLSAVALASFVVATVLLAAAPLRADTYNWVAPSGDWSNAGNWLGLTNSGGTTLPTGIDSVWVVNGGTAAVTQLGETCGTLTLGSSAGSGNVNITSGALAVNNCAYVGYSGTGSLTQSGGTNNIAYPQDLYLGYNRGSSGTYSLSGSGYLSATAEYLGYRGAGSFTQSGGTNNLSIPFGLLALGQLPSGSGTYNLSGGQLTAAREFVGSFAGMFQQSGGTNTVSLLTIASNGQYLLGGGSLQVAGLSSQGVVAGGSLPATLNNNGIWDFTAGTWQNLRNVTAVAGTNSLLIVPAGFNPAALGFASFSVLGLTHTIGTTLTVAAGQGFGGTGSIVDPVVCQGSIVASAGGRGINLSNSLTLSGTGLVNLGWGILTTDNTSSVMTGGSLFASPHYLGYSGTGSFTQFGGTNTCSRLYVGYSTGSSGTYNLHGSAYLCGWDEYLGVYGTGSFTQSGGTHSTNSLQIGYDTGGRGTYNLNGGLLNAATVSGGAGAATFNFNGGTLQASSSFSTNLPMTLGTSGGGATFDTAGHSVTLSGLLSGPGSLTLDDSVGTGTLILTASNTYTDGTFVTAGTLILDSNTAIADGSSLTIGANASLLFGNVLPAAPTAGDVQAVPEPATLALLAAGAIGLIGYGLRRRRAAEPVAFD